MTEQPMQDQPQQPEVNFMIQRLYLKGMSYETPNTPTVFQQKWEPELKLDLHVNHTELEQGVYNVVLRVTVTVTNQATTAFLIEVEQAGIFTIQGAAIEQKEHLLESFCPNILFPYAREAITAQVIRGSFPQLVLAPINFDALYMQKVQDKQKNSPTETSTH